MTEITDTMLDIIEQVKGKRNPALWYNRCESAMKRKNAEKLDKKTKKS